MKMIIVAAVMFTCARAAAAAGPVCNAEFPGDNGLVTAGKQWEMRHLYYCPQGATSLQFLHTGVYAHGTPVVEIRLVDPQVMNLSLETDVPPLWQPTTTYQVGAEVTAPTDAAHNGFIYVAVRPNINALPTANNSADWTTRKVVPIPVLCGGVRPCRLGTEEEDDRTVTDLALATDVLAVKIPPRSLIAVRGWMAQTGDQTAASGPGQTSRGGSYQNSGSAEPDLTLGGGPALGNTARDMGLFAILGQQNVAKAVPSVCILGDSRAIGIAGVGLRGAAVASGGSGYAAADIGQIVRNVDAGQSPDNVLSSGSWLIRQVSGGAVTQVAVYDPGHYAPAVIGDPGVETTNPVGVQSTTPVHATAGHGLTIRLEPSEGFSGSNGLDEDTATFAHGFVQRGLADAGIPFAAFSKSGDRLAWWLTEGGDTLRLDAIRRTGCSSAIIELGINDTGAGEAAALVEQELTTLGRQVLALGTVRAVYLTTLLPFTVSTDYWKTTSHQIPYSRDGARKAVNDWERKVPQPFAGTFDAAGLVEVNSADVLTPDGGYWIVNGSNHYATMDGAHPSPAGHALAARAISSRISILQ